MDGRARLMALLEEAAEVVGEGPVSLRFETALIETVYVEDGGEGLVATDRGETHRYLVGTGNGTYVPWSARTALDACAAAGVRFREERESFVKIEADIGETPSVAVQAVSRAIDAVFAAHMRPDLRRS